MNPVQPPHHTGGYVLSQVYQCLNFTPSREMHLGKKIEPPKSLLCADVRPMHAPAISITILSLILFICMFMIGCGSSGETYRSNTSSQPSSSSTPAKTGPAVGENAILDNTGTPVTVAATEEDLDAYFKVLQAEDLIGSMEMAREGRIFKVADKSKVLVLEVKGLKTKVRIMSAEAFGKAGWVMTPNVKSSTSNANTPSQRQR